MSNAVPLVQYSSISKAFGDNVVLDGLDFAVDEGEFAVVFGQSASGKSVLLRILLGLDRSTPPAPKLRVPFHIDAPGPLIGSYAAIRTQIESGRADLCEAGGL